MQKHKKVNFISLFSGRKMGKKEQNEILISSAHFLNGKNLSCVNFNLKIRL